MTTKTLPNTSIIADLNLITMLQHPMDTPQQLAKLDAETFGSNVLSILRSVADSGLERKAEYVELVQSRAAEPPTTAAISSILTTPIKEGDWATLKLQQTVIHRILLDLPLEQLQAYRPALTVLAAVDISSFDPRKDGSYHSQTSHNINHAKLLGLFTTDLEAAWVTADKYDEVSYRTLSERIHTGEQMRPYMEDLFNWMVDPNHPPFKPCSEQLARFPETAAAVAVEVMAKAGQVNDTEHQHYIIDFVSTSVPVGKAWIPLRPHVREMVRSIEKRKNEAEDDYLDAAKVWLAELEKWDATHVNEA
ncbi:hypothetical protein KAF25_003874 [Fusarium avenaceum]|uniref:DUF5071 domain-containing protein n=1 Tax=Fusarium avenaceum TaxID=40199 RepID=A0A9P7GYZ4_9HYPO|nr:hypothetical protein KAF25_003874 [Fusarium avenaceum]